MATRKTTAVEKAAASRKTAGKKAAATRKSNAEALARMEDELGPELREHLKPIVKVPISGRIDSELAGAIRATLDRDETMYDFISTAAENEFHRRRGTRPPRQLTLADMADRLDRLADALEKLELDRRKSAEVLARIELALGI